jgi:hypothetical protein
VKKAPAGNDVGLPLRNGLGDAAEELEGENGGDEWDAHCGGAVMRAKF